MTKKEQAIQNVNKMLNYKVKLPPLSQLPPFVPDPFLRMMDEMAKAMYRSVMIPHTLFQQMLPDRSLDASPRNLSASDQAKRTTYIKAQLEAREEHLPFGHECDDAEW